MQYERQQKILEIIGEKKTATVAELAALVFASEASVRRDVACLEQKGYVRRVYGGVVLSNYKNSVVPLDLRDGDNSSAKELIAKRAAELVFDGATVLMDASSTVRRMIKYLDGKKDLRIITNNQRIFGEADGIDAEIYCTGGIYSKKNHAFLGSAAESFVRAVHADFVFFSSQALSDDGEISDVSEQETALRRVMLEHADRKVFLCDSSKLGQRKTFTLCRSEDVDLIICDRELPSE